MASRYDDRVIYENTEEAHEELRESRGLKKIVHYNTATLGTISSDKYENISVISHTWSVGDRFYKLSYQYYGSTKYWWVIAQFNATPTESHVTIGQTIRIPTPLEEVIEALRGED